MSQPATSSREFEQLIERIARELLAAGAKPGSLSTGALCSCHGCCPTVCPDTLRCGFEAGADRIGIEKKLPPGAAHLAAQIDHTLLKPDATYAQVDELCEEAAQFGFATVCVNPLFVRRSARRLSGTRSRVCTVVGFPLGATFADVKAAEARRAIGDGATEVDMVVAIGALKSGDDAAVTRDIALVADACREGGAILKVILECCLLTDDEKARGARACVTGGADFVKTSTGFSTGGATAADVALLRRVVGPAMGVKAAGGIRDLAAAQAMQRAGADRIGASASVRIVREAAGEKPAAAPAAKGAAGGGYS
ncbi:MAG: deoxyribose-phosphate aldolase [Planctomycetes bacterium]|nr:deoxyribose-phosphate aldolase [Planctomycetota bacterium]